MSEHEDDRSRVFVNDLPRLVAGAVKRWSLDLGQRFESGQTGSYVASARTVDGQRAVLKIGWPHYEAVHEADGLRAWDGDGAVRLLDSHLDGDVDVLLLEACEPGTPLSALPSVEDQDTVFTGLVSRLWIEPAAGHPFRPLAQMCASWADRFEERSDASTLDPGLAREGAELFRRLPERATRSVLLCTDLNPGNVLAATREPWLMIDPKPYVGDPAYDALQYMINFPARLQADAVGFVHRLAGLLELDAAHLRRWLFARCVVESNDSAVLARVAPMLLT
jgi:streptomycin 6-kinase